MITPEAVEKAARAICRALHEPEDYVGSQTHVVSAANPARPHWETYKPHARAALESIMED